MRTSRSGLLHVSTLLLLAVALLPMRVAHAQDATASVGAPRLFDVTIPTADRFIPVTLQIRVGDTVRWTNNDTDDHTIVSVTPFDSTGPRQLNIVIPGTDSNGGQPGVYTITFNRPGMFLYHCRFHSHLDGYNQPVAPGPDGGIQDSHGNFGTPMMGEITVLPR